MMTNTQQALAELREAERHMTRALKMLGMARGRHGYVAPGVADALGSVRGAIANLEPDSMKRRGWSRLARAA